MDSSNAIKKTRAIVLAFIAVFSFLYLGQGFIALARLSQIDAEKLKLNHVSEVCDTINCTSIWTFIPKHRFLLLGHILRTHEINKDGSNLSLPPISEIRGTSTDSWATLRVYEVTPGVSYTLKASKYRSIKLGYFIGLFPRTSDHEGILSIPNISPTISTMTGLILSFILFSMFAAAYLGGAGWKGDKGQSRYLLGSFAVSGFFAGVAAFISLGILDSLLPEGDLRNKTLRVSVILSLLFPILSQVTFIKKTYSVTKLALASTGIVLLCLWLWPWIRGGTSWAMIMGSLTLAGCVYLLRLRLWLPAAIWSSAIFDSLKIIGYLPFSDYSPIYFNNVGAFATLILVAGYHGGFATISMAGLAYRRFRRDIVLNEIQNSIETSNEQDICARFSDLKNVLPDITQLVGAGKISVTISLPLGRPITQTYDVKSGEAKFFDDGKIPGAVTLRTLVYGDEAMFESFEEFASRLRLPLNSKLADSRYFCAIPLRVNQTIVGTLMLTSFEDEIIRRYKATTNEQMREIQEIIHLIGERLSQSLSKLMVQNMDIITDLSKSLQSSIHQSIAASAGVDEFLQRFVDSIGSVSHLQVMLHEHVHDRGIGLVSAGMEKNHWLFFAEHPFNLSKSAKPAYGPTVVAFRDGKSSYVKDIREIYDKMHSMTQEILSQMNTLSIIAIPLRTAQRSFVVTLLSGRSEAPADPALVAVVEATEALFVAAIEVMSQKTSVLALGQLASRLIGDDEVRTKILKAAKDSELATTIGSPRTSFLLLFDLIGSSELSEDTETKAQAYGRFYDAVNQKCQEVLGGMIRKTIGDAVIVTWDGTGVALDQRCTLLPDLKLVAHYADEIAKSIGCKGSRALLHFGHYFLGLVGTKTFGQIDVIGSGIDEVCKMEGIMKELRIDDLPASLAVSVTAVGQLPNFTAFDFQDSGFVSCSDSGHTKYRIEYAVNLMSLQVKNPYAA